MRNSSKRRKPGAVGQCRQSARSCFLELRGRVMCGFRPAVLISLFAAIAAAGCGERHARTIEQLRTAPLYTFTDAELDAYLKWLPEATPLTLDRVVRLARQNVGQPYRLGLLGEGPEAPYDADPTYCLSASDCVTFVEHAYAMALAHDWPSFHETLQRIRYHDGRIGFRTRNHFIESDWNVNNAWLFEDVTASLAPEAAAPMRVVIDRAAFFAKWGLETSIPTEVFETSYVPLSRLADVLPRLRDGDVVEIVRGTPDAPYVGHMGLILHAADGTATILHSASPAVREQPLAAYLQGYPGCLGVKILRPAAGLDHKKTDTQTDARAGPRHLSSLERLSFLGPDRRNRK